MVQEKACMIVWDNLNIAFKVAEQRHNSKDSFENGTTATLIALYGVLRGELELEILEPRTNRRPIVDFERMMIVVIFNLRDVMRNVQTQFKIPHHGISHSSPNAAEDIAKLQGWLESNNLQTYVKERPGHDTILRVRDLMVAGAAYANTPGAFKNFRRETRKEDDLMYDDEEFTIMADQLMDMAQEVVGI
ncbi:hypothetical protein B0H14DRAFT_3515886 [Mycena olivaceomarginata]|nr:hypothetical protein B0H14DRAFT_3515886 [Mycena olivaceomarginata]